MATQSCRCLWRYGVIGGFLSDKEHNIYAVTCRHVTRSASDGVMYLNINEDYVPFGKTLDSDFYSLLDVDVFAVDKQFHSKIDQVSYNTGVFSDIKQELYGRQVYSVSGNKVYSSTNNSNTNSDEKGLNSQQCTKSQELNGESTIETLIPMYKGVIRGCVASAEVHKMLEVPEDRFLVVCQTVTFEPGDSGTMIALENDGASNVVYVGIVTGADIDTSYIVCVLLSHCLQHMQTVYGIELHIYQENEPSSKQVETVGTVVTTVGKPKDNRKTNIQNHILSGCIVWVKTPEEIKPTDFNIMEYVSQLIDTFNDDIMNLDDLSVEASYERRLSDCVSSRRDIHGAMSFQNPAQQCYLQCIVGCDYLYSGDCKSAEKHLKQASRLIVRTPCKNRLLCKIVTYVTWLLLDNMLLSSLGELLKNAEKFMLAMQQSGVCPANSVGYFYQDYTYYYINVDKADPTMALKMAKEALYYTRVGRNSQELSVGTCLALGLIARLNLGCGENFENKYTTICTQHIQNAEDCLRELEGRKLCAVQNVDYLLTKSDLEYRCGNVALALDLAKQCSNEASANNLKSGVDQSAVRIDALTKMLG